MVAPMPAGCQEVRPCSQQHIHSLLRETAARPGPRLMSTKVTGWVWDQDLLVQRKAVLLWLAERQQTTAFASPVRQRSDVSTGLGEKMVRRHLHWLASDQDDDGRPKQPLVTIVERRVEADRNTSNVYVLHVPWARPEQVAHELDELKYMPADAVAALTREGVVGDPQVTDTDAQISTSGGHGRPPWGPSVTAMGVADGREEPGHRNRHENRNSPPKPPSETVTPPQQHGGHVEKRRRPPAAGPGQRCRRTHRGLLPRDECRAEQRHDQHSAARPGHCAAVG